MGWPLAGRAGHLYRPHPGGLPAPGTGVPAGARPGIGTFKTYNVGQCVDYNRVTGRSTYDSSGRIPTDPGTFNARLAIYALIQMAAKGPVHAPWTAPNALGRDGQTAETWIR